MVSSYNTLLAEGSITVSSRPQSAQTSRRRIDTSATSPGRLLVEAWLCLGQHSCHVLFTIVMGALCHAEQPLGWCCADVKVFANSLYDAGDILAGQVEQPSVHSKVPSSSMQTPPMSPMVASGSPRLQQQRVMAAQVGSTLQPWPSM